MNKLSKNKIIYAAYSYCFLFLVSLYPVFADVGNHSDYSSSGDGGGDSILWILYMLVDTFGLGGTFVIIIVGFAIFSILKKKGIVTNEIIRNLASSSSSPSRSYEDEVSVVHKVQNTDPYFDPAQFKGKVANMYLALQEAWEQKDWKIARPFESDLLFRLHSNQLNEYIQKQQTNVMDRVSVRSVDIVSYEEYPSAGISTIKVCIKASQIDYIKDDKTNRVVAGNPRNSQLCTYEWTLVRSLSVKSNSSHSGVEATCCPSCGAPLSIGMAGTCEYCNAQVSTGQYDWVLNEIQKIN